MIREDGIKVPFNFQVQFHERYLTPTVSIINGEEKIVVQEISFKGDSLFMVLPFFNTQIKALITNNGQSLSGEWIDPQRVAYSLKFTASAGKHQRFEVITSSAKHISGKWQAFFTEENGSVTPAILLIEILSENVLATFQTETGDYRFLEGVLSNDTLLLSVFDGSHAYLFKALLKGDSLTNGYFYAGLKYEGHWNAVKNPNAELRNPSSLTKIISKENISIQVKDLDGKPFIIDQAKLLQKVSLIQIMGTWCPNCLDESRFVSQLMNKFNNNDLQVFGLSFERSAEFSIAQPILKKYQQQLNIPYPLLYAGKASKKEAAAFFPMLDTIVAFPTLIIVDKKGYIREVHSGFNGPATGVPYTAFKEETYELIRKLLAE
jgi:thiol-disulfide isomerase/thioredoxin